MSKRRGEHTLESECIWEVLLCLREPMSIYASHVKGGVRVCVCVYVCVLRVGANTGPPFPVPVGSSMAMCLDDQHEQVIYVPILGVAVMYICMSSFWCVSVCWGRGPIHPPPPVCQGLRPRAAVGSSSASKRPAQPPWISMLFPEGDFPPHPPPFPLAHSAFPRQGPAAPSSFLLNHLLTLKSKPILV